MQRLCDVHLEVFEKQLEKQRFDVASTSPISILLEEHKMLHQIVKKLTVLAGKVQSI
ncbi:MAG: hypothetical protein FGF48_10875 [Candidatus Brockarchaeota archaeon]|nr:hypothetical protein [Candidatus Brockarchaeota archaeon]